MKALSIRQPWAYLIIQGHKDIENRKWNTKFRGKFLVHASQKIDEDALEIYDFTSEEREYIRNLTGGIIGEVELVDCITDPNKYRSPWFEGPYGFILKNPKKLPFKELKGALKFFEVDNI